MCSTRSRRIDHYRRAMPMHDGWEHIVSRGGRDFDPEVVDVFRSSVAPYPPGTGVVLSDGSCGIVKEVRQDVRQAADRSRRHGSVGRVDRRPGDRPVQVAGADDRVDRLRPSGIRAAIAVCGEGLDRNR